MSKSTFGMRKAGLSVLAVSLTLGAGVAGAGAAYAAAGEFTADSKPAVMQGASNQAAGDLNYEFANVFTTNTEITFTIDEANACDTQANIDEAIEFTAKPVVAVTKDTDTDGNSRVPSYTAELGSSSTQCATAGIQDVVTVTLTQPSSGDATDTLQIDLTEIAYNLGADAPLGDVDVTVAQGGVDVATTQNATVVNKSFAFIPLVAANPSSTGTTLGTATYSETTAGAYFESGDNLVTLTLSDGTFTADVTPTITVPAGYKVQNAAGTTDGTPKTTAANTYSFVVEAPTTLTKATVTVAGLKFDASATEDQVLLESVVDPATTATTYTDSSPAVNVVNYGSRFRIGGDDRYETAAKLFNAGNYAVKSAVLSGGELFPDALSANYLAGELNTGTLLTKATKLPDATKNALIDNGIETVYITGGPAAVSEAIEAEIEATHVSGNVNSTNFIDVVRLAGDDRYETNQRINSWVSNRGTGEDVALMAAGTAPFDSLAGGPVAYNDDMPLVLTGGADMRRGEQQQLIDMGTDTVVILGGTSVVSQGVEDELKADGYSVVRLAGANRYDTAAAIATWATEGYDFDGDKTVEAGIEASRGFTSATVNIANGLGFADALSSGPLAGSEGSALVLSKGADEVGAGTLGYLAGKTVGSAGTTTVDTLRALGLTAATSSAMIEDAAEAIETE